MINECEISLYVITQAIQSISCSFRVEGARMNLTLTHTQTHLAFGFVDMVSHNRDLGESLGDRSMIGMCLGSGAKKTLAQQLVSNHTLVRPSTKIVDADDALSWWHATRLQCSMELGVVLVEVGDQILADVLVVDAHRVDLQEGRHRQEQVANHYILLLDLEHSFLQRLEKLQDRVTSHREI